MILVFELAWENCFENCSIKYAIYIQKQNTSRRSTVANFGLKRMDDGLSYRSNPLCNLKENSLALSNLMMLVANLHISSKNTTILFFTRK